MELKENIVAIVQKIAASTVHRQIREEATRLDEEASNALADMTDEWSQQQTRDVFESERSRLYMPQTMAERRTALVSHLEERVRNCPEPAMPPAPAWVAARDIPADAEGLTGRQWHHNIPVWGLIAGGIDQHHDEERRGRMAAQANEENRRAYAAQCADVISNQYAYALGIPPEALKIGAQPTGGFVHDRVESQLLNPFPHLTRPGVQYLTGSILRHDATDLVAVHSQGTNSGHVEVDIYSAKSNWSQQVGHVVTELHCHDCKFLLGRYRRGGNPNSPSIAVANGQASAAPDLVMIKQRATGSGKTEIHILSGRAGWQERSLAAPTCLGETDSDWDFTMGDFNQDTYSDLIAIERKRDTQRADFHVLSGASCYQSFLKQGTLGDWALHQRYRFAMGAGGQHDEAILYKIMIHSTYSRTMSIQVLKAENDFNWPAHNTLTWTDIGNAGFDDCQIALSLPSQNPTNEFFNPRINIFRINKEGAPTSLRVVTPVFNQ